MNITVIIISLASQLCRSVADINLEASSQI